MRIVVYIQPIENNKNSVENEKINIYCVNFISAPKYTTEVSICCQRRNRALKILHMVKKLVNFQKKQITK